MRSAYRPILDTDASTRRAQNLTEKPKTKITTPDYTLTGPTPSGVIRPRRMPRGSGPRCRTPGSP
jgi:hypothetical protein